MRGAGANPSKVNASPGAIKKYMTQEAVKESPGKQTGASKIGHSRLSAGVDSSMTINEKQENDAELKTKSQLPTKDEMAEMFSRLELSLKGEMATLHGDLNQILKRVEETEEKLDKHVAEMKELNEQMEGLQREQRHMRYKIEDQENRNRRKNLRIRGLPETQGELLQDKMDKVFVPLLGRSTTEKNMFERVHRIRNRRTWQEKSQEV